MICNKCGANIPNNSKVCPMCGKAIEVQQNKNTKQNKKIILIIIIIVLVII